MPMLLAAAMAVSACSDKVEPHDEHPPEAIRLTVGTQTIVVRATGNTGAPIVLSAGQATAISAVFLDENDAVIDEITAAEFRLDVTPSTGITFSRSSAFAGTLTAASGTTSGTIQVMLWHTVANHEEFGPFPVAVTVN